jgi:periplasmic protein CpxP/Spy
MMRARWLTVVLALVVVAPVRAQGAVDDSQRPAVQALQRRMLEIVQRTLGASDDQMRQLADVNRRYQPERRELNQRDRQARQAIRAEVLRDSLADQKLVARELDALVDVQRKRIEIFSSEQRDLARFLTPVQRAKYATLQEGLRRKIEQLRQRQQENGLTQLQRRRLRQMRRMGDSSG